MSENIIAISENKTQLSETLSLDETLTARWIKYLDVSAKTVETYGKAIKQLLIYLGNNGITKPTREDIVLYRDELKAKHEPTTVQSYMAATKLFFQWTEQEHLYPNVAQHIKGAKIDTEHKKGYLTSKQSAMLLNAIDRSTTNGLRDYAMLSLMLTTGLRTVSVINANIEDMRNVGDNTALFYRGKGHDEKAVYVKLAEPVENAIREYLSARGKTTSTEPLFCSVSNHNNGGRLTTRSLSRIVKEYLKKIGLDSKQYSAHVLRHTSATLNLVNGASLEETQQLMGHKNINTTLIYSHAITREKNNSEQRIAKAIFG